MSTRDLKHSWKLFGFGYCTWELVIARDQDLCEGAIFYYFLWKLCRIRQDHAEPGEKQDHRSDRKWWKGYSRGRSW